MNSVLRPVLALLWKDVLLQLRTKDIVVSVLVFSLLVIVVFSFAIEPTPTLVALVAPGVLWVAIVFGGVLGMTRSFALEKDGENLHGLMLAPGSRDAIFFGKMLSNTLFMLLVEAVVFPIFAVLFGLSLAEPALLLVAFMATVGISTVGTLFSAMAVNTRAREVMLPLLFFPVAIPVIVAAVEATGLVLRGSGLSATAQWIYLLAAFDAIFLVVCPLAFHVVIEE
jgi:heme exporter protein B